MLLRNPHWEHFWVQIPTLLRRLFLAVICLMHLLKSNTQQLAHLVRELQFVKTARELSNTASGMLPRSSVKTFLMFMVALTIEPLTTKMIALMNGRLAAASRILSRCSSSAPVLQAITGRMLGFPLQQAFLRTLSCNQDMYMLPCLR